MIQSIVDKVSQSAKLSPGEREVLRRMFLGLQTDSAMIASVKQGTGDVNLSTIRAKAGEFETPPLNGSFFGPDYEVYPAATVWMESIGSGSVTPITNWETELITPQSLVVWHDKATGKFKINPSFENLNKTVLAINGNVNVATTASFFHQAVLFWYTRSGDTLKYQVPLDVRNSSTDGSSVHWTSGSLNQYFYLAELDSIGDLYFKILYWHNAGVNMQLDMTIAFSRFL